ncbi:hypothetical protein [Halomonas huangheensis]|uniref:Uncharacterized protein n=1 Tax=Halomonas huangheensis TaxID=1178482 RepID=W1N9L2_9GAMM|nr:hypothetical protein [Halomonas huangheensis]ALM53816.1 hypothetical protein AR456_17225 [Halomonas huangheensis]ERL52247.1 hypothetical protein BJB45_09785 [Halomonas huangheensis]
MMVMTYSSRMLYTLLPLLVMLGGCNSALGPMSWQSGYRASGVAATDTRTAQLQAIAPNTCDLLSDQSGIVTLPPGCANDINLQYMVERPQDLLYGREMGPAQAQPVATAARERLTDREQSRTRSDRLREEAHGMSSYTTTGGM